MCNGYDTAYNDIPIITNACNNWSKPNTIQCHLLAGDCSAGNQPFILPFHTSIRKWVINWNTDNFNTNPKSLVKNTKNKNISIVCIPACAKIGKNGFPNRFALSIQAVDKCV